MELTDKDLQRIYDVANQIFYAGTLPSIPVFLEDMGRDWGAHVFGTPHNLNLSIGVNYDEILKRYEAEAGPSKYSAYLIRTILHEMVHVYFVVSGSLGEDGGSRITGEPHTMAFAEAANSHGLHAYFNPWDTCELNGDGEGEYLPDETAQLFASHGIAIGGMDDERDIADFAQSDCFDTLEELQRFLSGD